MEHAVLGGVRLEYEMRGSGEPVAFVHHGAGADWFAPLCAQGALGRYRTLRYYRAGYAPSGALVPPLTFAREASQFRALAEHLGLSRVHLVGHSASACMALQFALEAPDLVHSLTLLEPALLAVPSPPEVPRAMELYREGDVAAAIDTFLRGTCGPDHRAALEAAVPTALARAMADAPTFFGHELPALRQWSFGPDEARRIHQPALAVVGDRSDFRFARRQELLLEWLPNVEPFVLEGAGHLLHIENPRGMAERLAAFFDRHPIAT
jgi:pimeloyl-ACP methyl ester carboxylesterase